MGPDLWIDEMSLVPNSGPHGEDDGALMGCDHGASSQRVPMGFHGNWAPAEPAHGK
jgi:carotenoid cleavage dioxygenase-like enzyme